MAERIDIDIKGRHGGWNRKYPWDTWTDGSTWRIQRGIDYEVHSSSMAGAIRNHAARNGLRAVTSLWSDGDGVEFQFLREPEDQAA